MDGTEDENDTPEGTDNVEPLEDDTAEFADEADPDEIEQDTSETPDDDATEDGGEEPETDEDGRTITVDFNGEKLTVDELKKGYLRQSDYTRKAQELANRNKALEADLQSVEGITQALVDYLQAQIPAKPDAALAARNPSAYVAQLAAHEQAMAKVNELIEIGAKPKEVKSNLTEQERTQKLARENDLLMAKAPETATEAGRRKFMTQAAEAAQSVGFSMDELGVADDHRLFILAHYAKIGMDAAKSRPQAKAKVVAAPPVKQSNNGALRNLEAVKRLAKTGSLRDAAKVDFD